MTKSQLPLHAAATFTPAGLSTPKIHLLTLCLAVSMLLSCVVYLNDGFLTIFPSEYSVSSSRLPQAIQVENVMDHLRALEEIALSHPSHSRSVANAYNQSAEYVVAMLKQHTTCDLSFQHFKVPIWSEESTSSFSLESPHSITFQEGVDFRLMRYGGSSAKITNGKVVSVEDGGCKIENFPKSIKGNVALISAKDSSSTCSLWDSAYKAQEMGAAAVIFYNSIDETSLLSNRIRIVNWKEGDPLMTIPVLSVLHSIGSTLLAVPSKVNIESFAKMTIEPTFNIICDTIEGDPHSIVMIGAHLDSVPAGPGMVDNASGSSSILEVFIQLYSVGLTGELQNKIRFAWWGAEEIGLLGSRHYCRELVKDENEFKKVLVYANHDMLASPNYIPYIYNGKTAPEKIRNSSSHLQQLYETFFTSLPPLSKFSGNYELREMSGGSDFYSFLEIGIPAGGLATGAGSYKTAEQRHRFGGFAKAALDPCYHQDCDTVENIGKDVLEVMAKSVGYIVESLGKKENLKEWLSS